MMSNLFLSLQITALGMGLVFGAIILLWAMMSLLTKLTADKDSVSAPSQAGDLSAQNSDLESAAAIAVAVALAEQSLSSARALNIPPTAIVSAWQLGMRTRQMTVKRK